MAETLGILVVDDELGMQLGVQRALRDYQVHLRDADAEVRFEVDRAGSGEEGIEKIAANPPQILLLDHKLPGISGLDVLERLQEMNLETLTIMITAYASLETAVTATKRGAYDFLAKPFTPAELKSVVAKAAARLVLARQARKLAEEKRQVRFQFIRVLGHELKAPLGAIEGYLRIIADRSAGDDPAAYAQMADRSMARLNGMRKLIEDLLDLTRIESGQKKRELDRVDLRDVAETAIESFTPAAEEKDVRIELHAPAELPLTADRGELEIILNNLVSNAVKYNRQGGRVDVTLAADPQTATVQVADTGIGLSDEDAAKLFADFVRIRNSKTRNIPGSGLGLSIVKKLAQLYGGDATVDSTEDVGTTFTVTLQRTPDPESTEDEPTGNPSLADRA